MVEEVDLEEQTEPDPPLPTGPPVLTWPPFGENVYDGNNNAVYIWDFANQLLFHTLEDGTTETRPFTEAEIALIPELEAQNEVETSRETARLAIKAIITDLQVEKTRVEAVIAKTNSTVTGGDTKDVARAARRIADATIELARFIQNM